MSFSWGSRYSIVDNKEAHAVDDEADDPFLPSTSLQSRFNSSPPRYLSIWTALNMVMFLVSLSLFGSWWYQTHWVRNAGYRQVSSYTPIFDRLDLNPSLTKINGTFRTPANAPFSRQMPNPVADEVWDEILIDRFIPVSRDEIVKLGKDPNTAVQLLDSDWGLGDDAYVAGLDVFHQLHCVDFLRRTAYRSYYNETPPLQTTGKPRIAELHINHCVDLLVQQLQCSGNVNLYTMHWVETEIFPSPDFSIHRQCPDFQALWDWRMTNTLDPHRFKEVYGSGIKPEGIQQAPNLWALDY